MIIIPIGFLIAAIVSFYKGYNQWKSGTLIDTRGPHGIPTGTKESTKKMSYLSIGANVFGIMFLVLAIGSFVWMQLEK